MGKKYFELHYNAHLSVSGIPMMEVDSVPVLRQLHDEINSVMENHEFGYEVYYFECDKDDCEVFEWDKKIGLLRTIDMYEMLRYFQHYRDDYYSRMNS